MRMSVLGRFAQSVAVVAAIFATVTLTELSFAAEAGAAKGSPETNSASSSKTAVARAARNGELDDMKRLLDAGADINAPCIYGLTPLQLARLSGHKELAEFLIQRGANAAAPLPKREEIVDALLTDRVSPKGAAVAVLVSRDGTILFQKAYGLADIARAEPAKVSTPFRIGSVTKQFTAAAILKLVEADKLKLTDPLSKFYPDFPRGHEITIEHLLTHTSGIHSYTEESEFMEKATQPVTAADLIARIKSYPLEFAPGDTWKYSNSGYVLLGDILEKVSGQSYERCVTKLLLDPADMNSTGVYRNAEPPAHSPVGYVYEAGNYKPAPDWQMSWAGGAGALYSTLADLDRWNEAVFSGKVLRRETFEQALTPVKTKKNADGKTDEGYGFGFGISKFRGVREIAHGGGLPGFGSFLLRLPDKNFTVVVLENQLPPKPELAPSSLAHEIVEIYFGEELAPRASPVQSVSDAALQAIVGRYDYGVAVMNVTKEGSHVYAQLGPQPRFEIFPRSETDFFWKVVDAQVTFVKDASGQIVSAKHHQGGQTINAPRLPERVEKKLDPAALETFVGRYDYGQGKTLAVTREGDHLMVQLTGQPKFETIATSDNEFSLKLIEAQLTFVKDADGRVTHIVHRQNGKTFNAPRMK
jgi:CubicO group peptidase (beta-lactamase class C family)